MGGEVIIQLRTGLPNEILPQHPNFPRQTRLQPWPASHIMTTLGETIEAAYYVVNHALSKVVKIISRRHYSWYSRFAPALRLLP